MASAAPHQDPISLAERLTPTEKRVFGLVKDTCKHFGLATKPRAAGGWVRDKLMNKESDDIDIAVDDMDGETFAMKLSEFRKIKGGSAPTVNVIKSNPEQSKHLATATFRIDGISIDCTNLRAEEYSSASRIPNIKNGTPLQDAQRRDFTMNALFYNILDDCVEDFLGNGREDLAAGVLRTPMNPEITFSDDPLRVLRAARFAGRFGFDVVDDIRHAAMRPDIKAALATKVSRERVGIEIGKMIKEQDAMRAMTSLLFLLNWNLRLAVFLYPPSPPTKVEPVSVRVGLRGDKLPHPEVRAEWEAALSQLDKWEAAQAPLQSAPVAPAAKVAKADKQAKAAEDVQKFMSRCGQMALAVENPAVTHLSAFLITNLARQLSGSWSVLNRYQKLLPSDSFSSSSSSPSSATAAPPAPPAPSAASSDPYGADRPVMMLAAALLPYYGYSWSPDPKKSKTETLVAFMVRDGLKLSKAETDSVEALVDGAVCFLDLLERLRKEPSGVGLHLEIGMLLRRLKTSWLPALELALSARWNGDIYNLSEFHKLYRFLSWLVKETTLLHPQPCWLTVPLYNGTALSKEFEVKGPHIGELNDFQIKWQLLHPSGTAEDARECLLRCAAYIKGGKQGAAPELTSLSSSSSSSSSLPSWSPFEAGAAVSEDSDMPLATRT